MKKILSFHPCTSIVSGGAPGADTLAKRYAAEIGVTIQEFLPNWEAHNKAAGYVRNELIAKACDELVAFWDKICQSTAHTIELAQNLGKPTYIYWSPETNIIEGVGI